MRSEITPLQINDKEFLIASTIERCPKIMMLRELTMNALEAAALAPENRRRVEFRITKEGNADKLAIWNTGPGMDGHELHEMCDLASSIRKSKSLDGNFGMGAKVASLPSNKFGLRYRSCKDGHVHEL
jgi:sensor histidine kinase regulating citrate/malate metabolism